VDAPNAQRLLEVAEDARPRMRGAEDAWARAQIETRYPDMLEALDWFRDHDRVDDGYRLASALVPFWRATGRVDDGDAWFARTLWRPLGGDARRARALYDHGYLVFWAGRYDLASQRFAEARELATSVGDLDLIALILAGMARGALMTDLPEAVRLLRAAIAVTDGAGHGEGRSSATHVLGVALQMSGDLEGARAVMSERLAGAREQGDEFVIFVEASNLSMVERQLGHLDLAEALSMEALRIVVARGDQMAIAWIVNGLAAVSAAQGDHRRAATLLGFAESTLAEAGGEWPPDEREQYEGTLATLEAALSRKALADARATGAGMTVDDATAYAMDRVVRSY
jgi:tetratricopeptide (TPR) repeat protein